jgi:oxaloacetate decarboxylase alpha subunit
MKYTVDGETFDVVVQGDEVLVGDQAFRVRVEGRGPLKTVYVNEQPFRIEQPQETTGELQVLVDAKYHNVKVEGGRPRPVAVAPKRQAAAPKASVPGGVPAPMAARILSVAVSEGQSVTTGDLLLIFEAMKMENEVRAQHDGTVKQVAVKPGDRVNVGDLLLVVE